MRKSEEKVQIEMIWGFRLFTCKYIKKKKKGFSPEHKRVAVAVVVVVVAAVDPLGVVPQVLPDVMSKFDGESCRV